MTQSRQRLAWGAGLCLLAFAYLLPGVGPGVAMDDSPETAAVCQTLGIGHPPGYPLHSMLGRLAILSLPGSPAQALGIWAALLMAVAVGLCALLAMQALEKGGGASKASLLFAGFCGGFAALGFSALKAQVAGPKGSVFGLGLCFCLGLFLIAGSAFPRRKKLRLLGLGLGLALAHHAWMLVPFLPLIAWLAWQGEREAWGTELGLCALWMLPGFSVYVYLPLRAALQPAWHWNHISALPELIAHALRLNYASADAAAAWSPLVGLALAADRLASSAGAVTLLLAALGLLACLRRGAAWLGFLGLCLPVGLMGIYVGREPSNLVLLGVGLLPCASLAAALAGSGLAWSLGRLKLIWLQLPLAGLGLVLLALQAGPMTDRRNDWLAEDYAANLATALPKASIFLGANDPQIFSIAYLQEVRQQRPDIGLLPVGAYWMKYVAYDLWPRWPGLKLSKDMTLDSFVAQNDAAQALYTGSLEPWTVHGNAGELQPQGLCWRFRGPQSQAALAAQDKVLRARFQAMAFRQDLSAVTERRSWEAALMPLALQAKSMSQALAATGQPSKALVWAEIAREYSFIEDRP